MWSTYYIPGIVQGIKDRNNSRTSPHSQESHRLVKRITHGAEQSRKSGTSPCCLSKWWDQKGQASAMGEQEVYHLSEINFSLLL